MGAQLNLWPKKMGRYQLRNFSKTSNPPRRPFEKERLDTELKLIGTYGLKNKREIWRVRLALAKIRATARVLLTKDEKDPSRIFEEDKLRMDYVLDLKIENFLDRRLQTLVFKRGLAKSIHHARVLIRQRHIRVGRQIVNVPSFMVRVES